MASNYAKPGYDKRSPFSVPDLDADDGEILSYRDRLFNDDAVFRNRTLERAATNLYYQLNRQWIELDTEVLLDGVRGYIFRDIRQQSEAEMPRPVSNYIASAVEVEMAALGKRELTANVITASRDPRIEAAAKVAKEILEDRLRKLNWNDIRELATFLTVVTGTGCIKSYWDETWSDLSLVGSPNAAACPVCPTKLSSNRVPTSLLETRPGLNLTGAQDIVQENPGDAEEIALTNCPTCTTTTPLVPFDVGEQDSQTQDVFGRSMGMYLPKGQTGLEIVTPFEIFPENSGIGVTPETAKLWAQATTRSLEWIEEHYPDAVDKIAPEDPAELMRKHPLLGEWSMLGRFDPRMDSGIFENHARVYEVYAQKSLRFPNGRALVIIGDEIVENGELIKSVDTPYGKLEVEKVTYGAARYKPRTGEFWGQALVDDLISPQNRLNGLDAQVIEARERMGSPNLLVSEAMDLSGPEWNSQYGSGKIMRFNKDPIDPTAKPEVFGSILMPIGVFQERDHIINDMKQIAGPQDVELGEAPRNISTTSGLQLLGEQAERRRAPRERALISMYEKIWSHQLRLLWTLRSESDTYETTNAEDEWEEKQYDRSALLGQTKVQIEKQAFVDKSLYQKEATREAQADGLIIPNTIAARKRILELRGLPTDVNDNENRQVDIAKRQWVDFVDEGIIPVIDESIDDFKTRWEVLGTFFLTDEGKRLEQSMGWPEILKKIAGWEVELTHAELADQQAIQFYGSRLLPPQQTAEMYAQGTIAYQQASAVPQDPMAAAQGMAPPPPQPPPPPVFLPAAKQDRIYALWKQMITMADQKTMMGAVNPLPQTLGSSAVLPPATEMSQQVDSFLRFRAVVDAYRLLAKAKAMEEMINPLGPSAPGLAGESPVPNSAPSTPQAPPQPGNTPGKGA